MGMSSAASNPVNGFGERRDLDLAIDDIDRVELEADYSPLFCLPFQIIERLLPLEWADAAIEKNPFGMPTLQL